MQEQEQEKPETKKKPIADNIIYVGQKPFMNYVNAVQMQFQSQSEVKVIARGKFISKAVDIAEVIRKKFMKEDNIVLGDIKIDSKDLEREYEGKKKKVSVSEVEITLKKP